MRKLKNVVCIVMIAVCLVMPSITGSNGVSAEEAGSGNGGEGSVAPGIDLQFDNLYGLTLNVGFTSDRELIAGIIMQSAPYTTGFRGILRICKLDGSTLVSLGFNDQEYPYVKEVSYDATQGQSYYIEFYGYVAAEGKEEEYVQISTTTTPCP